MNRIIINHSKFYKGNKQEAKKNNIGMYFRVAREGISKELTFEFRLKGYKGMVW